MGQGEVLWDGGQDEECPVGCRIWLATQLISQSCRQEWRFTCGAGWGWAPALQGEVLGQIALGHGCRELGYRGLAGKVAEIVAE